MKLTIWHIIMSFIWKVSDWHFLWILLVFVVNLLAGSAVKDYGGKKTEFTIVQKYVRKLMQH